MRRLLRRIVDRSLQRLGYRIARIPTDLATNAVPSSPTGFTMDAALARAAVRDKTINAVIDIGASNGQWTCLAQKHYPHARYLLIEAQQEHQPALAALAETRCNIQYVVAAAGNRGGSVNFRCGSLWGGAAGSESFGEHNRVVPMTTVDAEVAHRGLSAPYLLKLDTHGFEVEIIEGARETLEKTTLIVIEAYNFANNKRLRFFEMCSFLEAQGFRTIDMCDLSLRPRDHVFWQMDLVFARSSHSVFDFTGYD